MSESLDCHIVSPESWRLRQLNLLIRGWCLDPRGCALRAVRARVGEALYVGRYRLPPPSPVPDSASRPQADACGFSILIQVPRRFKTLVLEAQDEAGHWRPFFLRRISRWRALLSLDVFLSMLAVYIRGRGQGVSEAALDDRLCRFHDPSLDLIQSPLNAVSLPKISLVSVLYGKEAHVPFFLEALANQTYRGPIEAIMVDDASPDQGVARVKEFMAARARSAQPSDALDLRIVSHARNLGNCRSRNTGLQNATGEIVVFIDADCLMNRDFLAAHAEAHAVGDCDVVVGPCNLETGSRLPQDVLRHYEGHATEVLRESQLQEPLVPNSFLNCVTRNVSIRRSLAEQNPFDPDFSYADNPETGFGWEDIEWGYRLYLHGARIKFTPRAFSVHISHPSTVDEVTKSGGQIRNFRKLIEKHPDLSRVVPRWTSATLKAMTDILDEWQTPTDEHRRFLEAHVRPSAPVAFHIRRATPLRILTYRWHVPHQYELYKLPARFDLVTGLGKHQTGFTRHWAYDQRPMPGNARFVPIQSVRFSDYDLAILHFDENVLDIRHCNGVLDENWGATFRWFKEQCPLPKIAVCHGTPQFHGMYGEPCPPEKLLQPIPESRLALVNYVGEIPVVTNSHQAAQEWGFRRSVTLWHGFDPTEFPPASYRKGILSLGQPMRDRPHYRGATLFDDVVRGLPAEAYPAGSCPPDPPDYYKPDTWSYGAAMFRGYVDDMRSYSIYFNPTRLSPMPRARGEAMMCGLAVVTTNNHDADRFIDHGVDGYCSNDPDELRADILALLRHPDECRRIGQAGRRKAMDVFHIDRFLRDWTRIIEETLP